MNIWLVVPPHHEKAGTYVERSLQLYQDESFAHRVCLLTAKTESRLDYTCGHYVVLVVDGEIECGQLIEATLLVNAHHRFSVLIVGAPELRLLQQFYELYGKHCEQLLGVLVLETTLCKEQATDSACRELLEQLEKDLYCMCENPDDCLTCTSCNTKTLVVSGALGFLLLLACLALLA